jgi:hypothetical protein
MRLLELLDSHRVLTTQQAARATETPERTVLYRLERLRDAGMVDRIRPGRETGSAPQHWFLRRAGAQLVTGAVPVDARAPSGLFLAHAAAITEVCLALVEHGPQQGMVVSRWLTDRAAWQQWPRPGSWGPEQEHRLTPDALLGVRLHPPVHDHGGPAGDAPPDVTVGGGPAVGEVGAFLEVDLATMTQGQLKMKLARYLAYAQDRAWSGWAGACPPMLLLTTSEVRAVNFIRAAARTVKQDRSTSSWRRSRGDEIVAYADRLVILAAGVVRDPARAVTEPVWLLNNETFTPVMLREVLAERHVTGTQATVIREHKAQVEQREHIAWKLSQALTAAERFLHDEQGGQFLQWQSASSNTDRVLDDDPELAELLLAWHDNRHHEATRQALVHALHDRHHEHWVAQARRLLAATDHHEAWSRPFVRALLTLDRGDLLHTWTNNALDQPVPDDEPDPAWDAYQHARTNHINDQWSRLSRTRRWRTSRDEISNDYDHEHLRVCGRCAALIPTVAPHHDATCHRCGAQDDARSLTERDHIPTLQTRLDHVTAVLAGTTQPAVPALERDQAG